jgi:hypothetical protein
MLESSAAAAIVLEGDLHVGSAEPPRPRAVVVVSPAAAVQFDE